MPPDSSQQKRKTLERIGKRLLVLTVSAIGIALLFYQIQRVGVERLSLEISRASRPWLAIAFGLTVLRFVIWGLRLAFLSQRVTRCKTFPYFIFVMVTNFLGLLLPFLRAGGTLIRAHMAGRRFGGGTATHLGPNLLDQVLVSISWLLVAGAMTPFLAWKTGNAQIEKLSMALLVGIVLSAGVLWLMRRKASHLALWLEIPRPGRRGKLAGAGSRTLHGARTLLEDRAALAWGLVGGLLFVLVTGLGQYGALRAVGDDSAWWLSMLAVTVGGALGTASGTPGGAGVTEAAQIGFLASQGLSIETATASVIIARGFHYGFILTAGPLAALWEWRRGELSLEVE